MAAIDPNGFNHALQAGLAGLTVLGGGMASFSGWAAFMSVLHGRPPDTLALAVNRGLGWGFAVGALTGVPIGILSLLIQ
jgi:hypothetical protein